MFYRVSRHKIPIYVDTHYAPCRHQQFFHIFIDFLSNRFAREISLRVTSITFSNDVVFEFKKSKPLSASLEIETPLVLGGLKNTGGVQYSENFVSRIAPSKTRGGGHFRDRF